MEIISNEYFAVDSPGEKVTLRSSSTRVVHEDKTVSYLDTPSLLRLLNTDKGLAFAGQPLKAGWSFDSVKDFDNSPSAVLATVRFVKQDKKEAK